MNGTIIPFILRIRMTCPNTRKLQFQVPLVNKNVVKIPSVVMYLNKHIMWIKALLA